MHPVIQELSLISVWRNVGPTLFTMLLQFLVYSLLWSHHNIDYFFFFFRHSVVDLLLCLYSVARHSVRQYWVVRQLACIGL